MLKTDTGSRMDSHQASEETLSDGAERFRYLAEAAFEGIVIHAQGVLITGNRQAFEMFGYEMHELIGQNALPIVIAEECLEMVADKMRKKDVGPYEAVGLRKDGSRFPIEVRAREIEWEGRKARVAAVMDITERKRAEAALLKANEELEQRVAERTEDLVEAIGELQISQDELRHLSSKILTTQEDERRRIAGKLHDNIGQTLSAVKLKLSYALDKMSSEDLQEAQKLWQDLLPVVQNSIEEVRRISEGLRPPVLDDLGILSTISWFCADFKESYGEIHIEEKHSIVEKEIPDTLKIVLYRVLQESMHNVVRHSQASRVTIALTKIGDTIQMKIEDNGKGFDTQSNITLSAPHCGLGFGTMKERVQLTGGRFKVESTPGQGTTITARWSKGLSPSEQ